MKPAWYNKKWAIILLHAAAWTLLFSLPYLLRGPENEKAPSPKDDGHMTWFYLAMNLSWMAAFYFNALVLVPKLINQKKYWQFAGANFLVFTFIALEVHAIPFLLGNPFHFAPKAILFNSLLYLFFFALSTSYQLIREKVASDQLEQEKQNEVLKTELSLLRSQVSPHFMFNVLNNMVSLARKQSDLLEPSLIKLSSLMRYMLYEADEEKVSIEKEMDYLQSYIDLQQQRFGKKLQVNVNMHTVDSQARIEPMLLIPFVENAFKHGTGMIEDASIDIDLNAARDHLSFVVRNKYNPASQEIRDKTSGIGLANVKRRLALLYGKKHQLNINPDGNVFTVRLEMELS